jgi:zinc transport system permease protein
MIEPLLLVPLLAGLAIACVAGPIGCVLVWQRLAYFADSLAHSALLGVAFSLFFKADIVFGLVSVCVVFALLLVFMQERGKISSDTVLAVLAHVSLAFGLIALHFVEGVSVDLESYLLGDILFVSKNDFYAILAVSVLVLAVLIAKWRDIMRVTLSRDLLQAEEGKGVNMQITFVLLLALFVAVAIQLVGILLLASLFIIPVITVRYFAKTPEGMAILASIAGCINVIAGVFVSMQIDSPTSATIVAFGACAMLVASLFYKFRVN